MDDTSKLIKLTTCDNSIQANILKGKLDTEGVDCALSNENMNTIYGGIYSTFTSVGVFVREEDYDKAVEIINNAE